MNPFFGKKVIQDINLTRPVEDWSEVRSKSRAKRRKARGMRQRVRTIFVPIAEVFETREAYIMHPAVLKQLLEAAV